MTGFKKILLVHCDKDDMAAEVFLINEDFDYNSDKYKDSSYLMEKCAESENSFGFNDGSDTLEIAIEPTDAPPWSLVFALHALIINNN